MVKNFRGRNAPASLKPDVAKILASPGLKPHFRGRNAPASLKQYERGNCSNGPGKLPGQECPGLIEASEVVGLYPTMRLTSGAGMPRPH